MNNIYIKNIELKQENLIIYYPTAYISDYSTNTVKINQTIISASQNLEKNNSILLFTEKNNILNLTKTD